MHIAFFGLGNMGFPIAANLLKTGHRVTTAVHRDPAPAQHLQALGGTIAASPAEALRDAELIFTIVPNDNALLGLLNEGFLSALPAGSVVVEMTSASAAAAEKAAALCAARGVSLLDAPVSGGVKGAANGTMSMLCAGDREVFDRVTPVLRDIAGKLCYVGSKPGQGKIIKSLNNLLSAINKTAVGEAWRMAEAHGVDPDAFFDAVSASSGDSAALRASFPKIRSGDYAPGFTVALMRKDLELAMALADGMTLPLGEAVLDYYRRAREFDSEDSTAVAKVRYPDKA
ncbi:NAD(P)-dependent oxidoreductase [Dysosmobacter sp. Sow4_B12]|uniref:NAD(P)-dependent oxidoreductase n=1 Tax=Dysosmobacter sp. Sow4_B12 TaxID=3438777 RepID=UPI003F921596